MANPRIRGKIPYAEWSKIAQRFAAGDSLAAIARDYSCTAPAIRYIVQREARGGTESAEKAAVAAARETPPQLRREAPPSQSRREAPTQLHREVPKVVAAAAPESGQGAPIADAIWSNVNGDITHFLAAVDALFGADTDENRADLLAATDRLLRASARTRRELERAFETRPTGHPAKVG